MSNKIYLKRSNVPDKVPTQLDLGEIAANTSDGKLYLFSTKLGNIVQVGYDKVSKAGDTMTGSLISPAFVVSGGTASQFLKANGTLDSRTFALDSNVVHLTGEEVISGGTKIFFNNDLLSPSIAVANLNSATGVQIDNRLDGEGLIINNTGDGLGIEIANQSGGTGLSIYSNLSGKSMEIFHASTDNVLEITASTGNGNGIVFNSWADATGKPFQYIKDNIEKAYLSNSGNFVGQKFIKSGGTSSQFLKADGSVDENNYASANDISQLKTEEFVFTNSQTFTLSSNYSQIYSIEVQGQGALRSSQYTLSTPNQFTILDTLDPNDYIIVMYSSGSVGTNPYYTQAETDILITTKQITGAIILSTGWNLVNGFYEYVYSNPNITSSSIVDIIPDNTSVNTVLNSAMLPRTDSFAGSVKLYSTNKPNNDISVTINISR